MNAWEMIDRIPIKLTDAAMLVGSTAVISAWGTYEIVGQTIGYTDAGAVTGMLCCGGPIVVTVGGYRIYHRFRSGFLRSSGVGSAPVAPPPPDGRPPRLTWAEWWRLLREHAYASASATPTPSAAPPSDAPTSWLTASNGIHRARRPVYPIGQKATGGLVGLDFRQTPHILVTGQTGSGKTKAVLRPLAVMTALSGLFQVVIFDKSGRNFRLLQHPDIHLATYSEESLPELCEALYGEVRRRDAWLAQHPDHPEELSDVRADRRPPRLLVIIDEFANTMGSLLESNRRAAGRVTSALIRVAQEGRAMGIHLALVAQRPDATQINTTLRGQLSGITFVMRDANDARIAQAPGAETLERGEAIFSHNTGYERMQMFYPTPEELRQGLALAEARDWGRPSWLPEGVVARVTDELPLPLVGTAVSGAHHPNLAASYGMANQDAVAARAPDSASSTARRGGENGVGGGDSALFASRHAGDSDDRSGDRDGDRGGDNCQIVTAVTGDNGWDLGVKPTAHSSNRDSSPLLSPVTGIGARIQEFLVDETASPIEGLSIGQAQAIALALLAGESLSQTTRLVFGDKNSRYFGLVKAVQGAMTDALGAGE